MKGTTMEVIERGEGWAIDVTCTGKGNGGGGCQSKLKVNKENLYITQSHHYDGSSESYITFRCPECQIETDVDTSKVPSAISRNLRGKKEWEALATDIIDCAENVVSHINNKEELKFAVAEVIKYLKEN